VEFLLVKPVAFAAGHPTLGLPVRRSPGAGREVNWSRAGQAVIMVALSVERAGVGRATRRLRWAVSAVKRARGALAGWAGAFDNQGGRSRGKCGPKRQGEDGDGARQG